MAWSNAVRMRSRPFTSARARPAARRRQRPPRRRDPLVLMVHAAEFGAPGGRMVAERVHPSPGDEGRPIRADRARVTAAARLRSSHGGRRGPRPRPSWAELVRQPAGGRQDGPSLHQVQARAVVVDRGFQCRSCFTDRPQGREEVLDCEPSHGDETDIVTAGGPAFAAHAGRVACRSERSPPVVGGFARGSARPQRGEGRGEGEFVGHTRETRVRCGSGSRAGGTAR
jgi:hypothetical protein